MSGAILFVRVVVSLGIVLGLMWVAARMVRSRGIAAHPRKLSADARIEVIDRRGVAKNSAIAVVRVAGQHLIVGITDQQITTLGVADDAVFRTDEPREDRVALRVVDGTVHGASSSTDVDASDIATRTAYSATGTDGTVPHRSARMGLLDVMRERTVRRI